MGSSIEDLEPGDSVIIRLRAADPDMDGHLTGRFLERVNYGRGVRLQLRFVIMSVNGRFLMRREVHQWSLDEIRRVEKCEVVA